MVQGFFWVSLTSKEADGGTIVYTNFSRERLNTKCNYKQLNMRII